MDKKYRITIAVLGYIGSGKSTLCGRLAIQLKQVSDQKIQEIKMACQAEGKEDLDYAYVMDTKQMERERKQSMDTSLFHFETNQYAFTIIDTPGNTQYTKNMMTGTCLADVGILMVSAASGEFEKSMGRDGSTRDFILHSYALGIKQLIICINKMDDKEYHFSQSRYEEIKKELANSVQKIGFNMKNIQFIPVSALLGDNLVEKSIKLGWYNGITFLQSLDNLQPIIRPINGDLRLAISYIFSLNEGHQVITGKIESGILKPKSVVCFAPFLGQGENKFEVQSIEIQNCKVDQAVAGENVGFSVKNLNQYDLPKGSICGYFNESFPKECETFDAEMVIINHPGSIKRGFCPMFCIHQAFVACEFVDILSKVERKTAQQITNKPDFIKNGEAATVRVKPTKPIYVEKFSFCPPLGRFIIRDMNTIVAIGVVKDVNYKQQ